MKATNKQDKPSVLIVGDSPGWAYHIIANCVKSYLSPVANVYIDFASFHTKARQNKISFIRRAKHSLVRQWKKMREQRLRADNKYDLVVYLAYYLRKSYPLKGYENKYVLGIYTSSFPPQGVETEDSSITQEDFEKKYIGDAFAVVCGDPTTAQFFQYLHVPVLFANGGSKGVLFKRLTPKQKNISKEFVVGWTGVATRKMKGYYDFVVPAVEEAAQKRPGIRLKSRFSGPIKTLPRFYDDVDVVLIASSADSGPSMFGEAAQCDVPAISTKVGFPASVIRDGINGFFVERDIHAMAEKIIKLYDDREVLYQMSQRIRQDYLNFNSDEIQSRVWRRILEYSLQQN